MRSRPMRLAFLVEDSEHVGLALDGIFADCYRRWGGRFSLVVPCVDRQIKESYWRWLEAFDPDVIYSYVELPDTEILKLHERLGPSAIEFHKHHGEPRLDVFGFKPEYRMAPLSSLSTIFQLARHGRHGEPLTPLSLIDCWHTSEPSRFLSDNFGTYRSSYATGIYPADARGAAEPLTIVSPEHLADRHYAVPTTLRAIPDEQVAFRALAEQRATSLARTSIIFATKPEVSKPGWSDSFNLVIGDSLDDRLLFWNARLLIPSWLDRDLCCLRISTAQLDDEEFFSTLVLYLNRHIDVNNGAGGQAQLTIRSASLMAAELEMVAARLRAARAWSWIRVEPVADADVMIPSAGEIEKSPASGGLWLGAHGDWTELEWQEPKIQPAPSAPDHLSDVPPRQQFGGGVWANDFLIEADHPGPRLGTTNYWCLPRRWRMAEAFKASFARPAPGPIWAGRASREGFLTLFQSSQYALDDIAVPSCAEAIRYALARDGRWATTPGHKGAPVPASRSLQMGASNEARYLKGVVGLAGDFGKAVDFLLHPFLRGLFSQLGGTPSLPLDKVAPTVQRLQRQFPATVPFNLADESDTAALGRLIVKASQDLKSPSSFLRYGDLVERWRAHRTEFWTKFGKPQNNDPAVDWEAHEMASLDTCLAEMRSRNMLFQGHQWTCAECHHRNWVDFSGLAPVLSCAICRHAFDAPISFEWLFRANEFLIEALRDHSVLSLLWAIGALRYDARFSFLTTGPSWFWFNDPDGPPEAEADLLLVIDGRSVVCEVKSSWTGVRSSDLEKLAALAKRLAADVAVLAVMDIGEKKGEKIAATRVTLAAVGIEFKVITLSTHPLDDDPYLA